MFILANDESGQTSRGGSSLAHGQVGPLEDRPIAEVVAHDQVLGEYLEEIDSADLFLELGTVEEHDVLAVGCQFEERLPDAAAREVGYHRRTQK